MLGKKISLRTAALINAASRYTNIVTQLVFSMILARILTPDDYGIVAITGVFTSFFVILSDLGISSGIIQDKTLMQDEINGIFRFSWWLSLLLAVIFALLAYPIAQFYNIPVLITLGWLLAISLFFFTLNMVPNALLMKDCQFLLIAKRNIVIPVLTSLVTVGLAMMGWKYYALVLQSVLAAFITFVVNYYSARKRYQLAFCGSGNYHGLRKIFSFSFYQFAFNLINYFSRNLDNLLIGRFFGAEALGYYDKAYRLMTYPSTYLTHVVTPVLQPILSEYQERKDIIYEKYIKLLKFLSLIGVFVVVFCYFSADDIIYIMYGEQWIVAVPYFQVLTISVWSQLLCGTTGSIYASAGSTKLLFVTGLVATVLTVIGIVLGLLEGSVFSVARNVSITYIVQFFFVMWMLIKKCLRQSFIRFLGQFIPETIMLCGLYLTGYFFTTSVDIESHATMIIYKLFFFGSVYIFFCTLLNQWKFLYFFKRNG